MAGDQCRASGQGVEEAGLARVGQADEPDAFHTQRVLALRQKAGSLTGTRSPCPGEMTTLVYCQ